MSSSSSSAFTTRLQKRLTSLTNNASSESIQTISKWIVFNRKRHGRALLSTWLSLLRQQQQQLARKVLYLRVIHEILLVEQPPDKDKGDKLLEFRILIGESYILSALESIVAAAAASKDADENEEDLLEEVNEMVDTWDELNVFGGPTIFIDIRRVLSTGTSASPAQAETSAVNIATDRKEDATFSTRSSVESASSKTREKMESKEENITTLATASDNNELKDDDVATEKPSAITTTTTASSGAKPSKIDDGSNDDATTTTVIVEKTKIIEKESEGGGMMIATDAGVNRSETTEPVAPDTSDDNDKEEKILETSTSPNEAITKDDMEAPEKLNIVKSIMDETVCHKVESKPKQEETDGGVQEQDKGEGKDEETTAPATVVKDEGEEKKKEFDFESHGIEYSPVSVRDILEPCKTIATMQIARDLRNDSAVQLGSLLSLIPPKVEEVCTKALNDAKNQTGANDDGGGGGDDNNDTDKEIRHNIENLNEVLPTIPDDILDLDINESLRNVILFRDIVKKQQLARQTLINLFIQSRCKFGAMEAAKAFYDLGSKIDLLKKRKDILLDAMALEGLDMEAEEVDEEVGKKMKEKDGVDDDDEDKELEPFSWYNPEGEEAEKEKEEELDDVKERDTKRVKVTS